MAYLSPIYIPKCDNSACRSSATEWLVNRVNGHVGAYCNKHKQKALKEFIEKHELGFE